MISTKCIRNVSNIIPLSWSHRAWPCLIPNLWLGTSVCNQKEANLVIPELLKIPMPMFVLFISPLLDAINLRKIILKPSDHPQLRKPPVCFDALEGWHGGGNPFDVSYIGWVVCSNETNIKDKSIHTGWVSNLRDQCRDTGTPFWFDESAKIDSLLDSPETKPVLTSKH